jgi:hypothetical protein
MAWLVSQLPPFWPVSPFAQSPAALVFSSVVFFFAFLFAHADQLRAGFEQHFCQCRFFVKHFLHTGQSPIQKMLPVSSKVAIACQSGLPNSCRIAEPMNPGISNCAGRFDALSDQRGFLACLVELGGRFNGRIWPPNVSTGQCGELEGIGRNAQKQGFLKGLLVAVVGVEPTTPRI